MGSVPGCRIGSRVGGGYREPGSLPGPFRISSRAAALMGALVALMHRCSLQALARQSPQRGRPARLSGPEKAQMPRWVRWHGSRIGVGFVDRGSDGPWALVQVVQSYHRASGRKRLSWTPTLSPRHPCGFCRARCNSHTRSLSEKARPTAPCHSLIKSQIRGFLFARRDKARWASTDQPVGRCLCSTGRGGVQGAAPRGPCMVSFQTSVDCEACLSMDYPWIMSQGQRMERGGEKKLTRARRGQHTGLLPVLHVDAHPLEEKTCPQIHCRPPPTTSPRPAHACEHPEPLLNARHLRCSAMGCTTQQTALSNRQSRQHPRQNPGPLPGVAVQSGSIRVPR
ncbi:hypothetical protein B0H67DRAFT_574716 [Lasiosphaeris hirsuta]|uniref:Uncharacterized protein n=1 Tax=Lasiosphaeris hirsuta TaxID=260670 RepID=A0AA40AQ67_9PEZI|nr:hypothetical protein B0H67DRAFT_574716 [Lasiosphaeris hirsuta]